MLFVCNADLSLGSKGQWNANMGWDKVERSLRNTIADIKIQLFVNFPQPDV